VDLDGAKGCSEEDHAQLVHQRVLDVQRDAPNQEHSAIGEHLGLAHEVERAVDVPAQALHVAADVLLELRAVAAPPI